MPHLFVNRPRRHALVGRHPGKRDNFKWETINTGAYLAGGVMLVWGSVLFVCGVTVNVLQIIQAPDLRTLQFMNLTALTFVTGSMLFVVASIPYLFSLQSTADQRTIDAFLASQYVVGSALFLLGGSFNYWRARIVANRESDTEWANAVVFQMTAGRLVVGLMAGLRATTLPTRNSR